MILNSERCLRISQFRILGRTALRGILSGYNGQAQKGMGHVSEDCQFYGLWRGLSQKLFAVTIKCVMLYKG